MRHAITTPLVALLLALTLAGCEREEAPQSDAASEDASVDERMSPASENRPAGQSGQAPAEQPER